MNLSKENSELIKFLRFPLIMAVVIIHSYGTSVMFQGVTISGQAGIVNNFIQELFSQVLCRTAVPLFFLFSGLLLFQDREINKAIVLSKYKSRYYSLLIPFLIWNILALAVYGTYRRQIIPFIQSLFSGAPLAASGFSLNSIVDSLGQFYIAPINYPLWFIRDLIILVIISPLLHFLLKKSGGIFLLFPLVAWFGFFMNINPLPYFAKDGLFFFSLGLFLGFTKTDNIESFLRMKPVTLALLVGYFVLALIETVARISKINVFYLQRIDILIGILAVYSCTFWLMKNLRIKQIFFFLAPMSFFIFLSHGILLPVVKVFLYLAFHPNNDMAFLFIYFISPVITAAVLILVYCFLNSKYEPFLSFLIGRMGKNKATAEV